MAVTISFDSDHAEQYGINSAILLFHFRHWIELNHSANRNQNEGRTWTYHKQKELLAHFPFWTRNQLRTALEKLTGSDGPMIKGNFNLTKYDRTTWFAFKNQDEWIRERYKKASQEDESHQCNGEKPPMERLETTNRLVRNHPPIPDNNTDNNHIEEDPPSPQKGEVTTEVETLCNHFFEKIKEKNPSFKVKNPKVWKQDLDKLMRIDKRSFEEVKSMIDWVSQDPFWKSNILSPDKLREKFSELEIKRAAQIEKSNVEKNKKYCLQAKAKYPEELRDLVLTSTYAMNKANGKDVSLNWPFERFKPAFVAIFGGETHG